MSLLSDIFEHLDTPPGQLMSYIDEYELVQPHDCMIDTVRAIVLFFAQEYVLSEQWIQKALQKIPVTI